MANCAAGVVVPTPTLPALSTMKLVLDDEPITKAGALPSVLVGLIDTKPHGVVEPNATYPWPVTRSDGVEVPWSETEKMLVLEAFCSIANCVNGEEVETPTFPPLVTVKSVISNAPP